MVDVGVVGLGTIARTHLEVLGSLEGVRVVFGVDSGEPLASLPDGVPLFGSLGQAIGASAVPDLLVIATPTPTHVDLASQALSETSALVLVEKPLSHDPAQLAPLEAAHGREVLEERLRVAHHFAFSPEVLWAADLVAAHPEWGVPVRIVSTFNDAYATKPVDRLASLVSSWVDSGGNQLSVLRRFATGFEVGERAEADGGFRCACRLSYDGGEALLTSNWLAGDSSKQTALTFADGVEVRMDHTSMTVTVVRGVRLQGHRGNDGTVGRKFAHYDGLYRKLFAGEEGASAGYALARETADLLGSPASGGAGVWH